MGIQYRLENTGEKNMRDREKKRMRMYIPVGIGRSGRRNICIKSNATTLKSIGTRLQFH